MPYSEALTLSIKSLHCSFPCLFKVSIFILVLFHYVVGLTTANYMFESTLPTGCLLSLSDNRCTSLKNGGQKERKNQSIPLLSIWMFHDNDKSPLWYQLYQVPQLLGPLISPSLLFHFALDLVAASSCLLISELPHHHLFAFQIFNLF